MCGVVGIVSTQPVNQTLYNALTVLQHRGQDAAGIVTWSEDHGLKRRKANGLVRDVFRTRHMMRLKGNVGIGSRIVGLRDRGLLQRCRSRRRSVSSSDASTDSTCWSSSAIESPDFSSSPTTAPGSCSETLPTARTTFRKAPPGQGSGSSSPSSCCR